MAVKESFENVAATADDQPYTAKYTETQPADGWESQTFNDAKWNTAQAPFTSDKKSVAHCGIARTFGCAEHLR